MLAINSSCSFGDPASGDVGHCEAASHLSPATLQAETGAIGSNNFAQSPRETTASKCAHNVQCSTHAGPPTVLAPRGLESMKTDSMVDESDGTISVSDDSEDLSPPVAVKKPGAVEIFCGCARQTKEFAAVGFEATGVDYIKNKDKPVAKATSIDLRDKWGQDALRRLIKQIDARIAWLAPPCGSAARCREIRRKNGPDPKPLRSDEFPDGLPGLEKENDKERVRFANKLYKFVAEFALEMAIQGIDFVIENPTNSLFWKTSWMQNLIKRAKELGLELKWAHMQMCMHGGERDKKTTLLYFGKIDLSSLEQMCDKSHTHKKWGMVKEGNSIWATDQERNYPVPFCKKVAKLAAKAHVTPRPKRTPRPLWVKSSAPAEPKRIAPHEPAPKKRPKVAPAVKKWSGQQSRRSTNDLVPEFKEVIEFRDASQEQVDAIKKDYDGTPRHCGSYVLNGNGKVLNGLDYGDDGSRISGRLGIYRSPEEFVKMAKQCTHPLDEEIKLPDRIANVIFQIATQGKEWVVNHRETNLDYYRKVKEDLAGQEKTLHESMHPDVERVMKSKAICLFSRMLKDIGYSDMGVVHLLSQGVKLVGLSEKSGVWQEDDTKLPTCSIEHLWAAAQSAQESVLSSSGSGDAEMDVELWKLTEKEVEDKLLVGPLAGDEREGALGKLWVPARRFGIVQSGKIRPVDNFSEFGTNQAFGSPEKVGLLSIDHVVAWARAWMEAVTSDRKVRVVSSDGQVWEGVLHESWTLESWRSLAGRVADLKNAYKQMASSPAHACFSAIGVWNPNKMRVEVFKALSLMFGETAAVYSFLRVSRALSHICSYLFLLLTIEFFDDFTQIESKALQESAMSTLESVFELLGWDVSMTEKKRLLPAECFNSLGVLVDLSRSQYKQVVLFNKEGRIEGIMELVKAILCRNTMGFKDALSLKGKLQFAEGQLFFRVAAPVCRLLSRWASNGSERRLTDEMSLALRSLQLVLDSAGPRVVEPRSLDEPIIIFTDGACEPSGSTIGGIIFIRGMRPEVFGARLTAAAALALTSKVGQTQIIGQAELLPVLVAKFIWRRYLKNRRVIYFIDNDSARLALVRGYSPVLTSLNIIMRCAHQDSLSRSSSWYARVPTKSNIGDGPSRLDVALVKELYGARVVATKLEDGERWFTDSLVAD